MCSFNCYSLKAFLIICKILSSKFFHRNRKFIQKSSNWKWFHVRFEEREIRLILFAGLILNISLTKLLCHCAWMSLPSFQYSSFSIVFALSVVEEKITFQLYNLIKSEAFDCRKYKQFVYFPFFFIRHKKKEIEKFEAHRTHKLKCVQLSHWQRKRKRNYFETNSNV